MNADLIAVLESMEREKGVSREVLLQAVETALVSAAKRVLKAKEAEVVVKIDPETGDIVVTSNGERIESREFGRIAAHTAKQVIIQKIREAEKDVIYDEFHHRVNTLINGTVYRYEKGAVILEVGKAEAILPKSEQSPRDRFRQGDRIRAYVLEVSKTIKGPQIVVSRTHPGLVKKLFAMEVPEVLESIVEIKNVSREPGDRAKIAVWSKDEKVDCVGACVGLRGSRVKGIVKELQGEKIDIVRWSENTTDYIQAALSPAQCSQIQVLSQEEKRVEVLVDEDQLSLAIGKNGQNVRLASKLTGWNIDIKSKKEAASALLGRTEAEPQGETPSAAQDMGTPETGAVKPAVGFEEFCKHAGLTARVVKTLKGAGYDDVERLSGLSLEELMKLEGIGPKTAGKISTESRKFVLNLEAKKDEPEEGKGTQDEAR